MSNPIGITPYSRDKEFKNSVVDCQGVSSKTESEGAVFLTVNSRMKKWGGGEGRQREKQEEQKKEEDKGRLEKNEI